MMEMQYIFFFGLDKHLLFICLYMSKVIHCVQVSPRSWLRVLTVSLVTSRFIQRNTLQKDLVARWPSSCKASHQSSNSNWKATLGSSGVDGHKRFLMRVTHSCSPSQKVTLYWCILPENIEKRIEINIHCDNIHNKTPCIHFKHILLASGRPNWDAWCG